MARSRPGTALGMIRAVTRLCPVPLVPEIQLHQASEPISLWEHTELAAGQTGLAPPFWGFAWPGGQALARYLLDHPAVPNGQQVADLGSGSAVAPSRGAAASARS